MAILPKAIYMFNAIPIKILMTCITEIEKSTLKVIWKHKTPQIAKAILSKKSNAGGITNTWLQTILQSNSNKNCMVLTQEQTWGPVEGIEDLDMNPHSYTHLIFDKDTKNIGWRKDSFFNKCCWEKWLSICKRLKLDPCLSPYTSINSKWINDLNIRPQTLKLVQEKNREYSGSNRYRQGLPQ
jgi:hypothetical protein